MFGQCGTVLTEPVVSGNTVASINTNNCLEKQSSAGGQSERTFAGRNKHRDPRELTHKLHTARAEQSWIIFLDVSDGFVYQFFNVLYAHSFPCWAHLKRKTADKHLITPIRLRDIFFRASYCGEWRSSREKHESRVSEQEVQLLCPLGFKVSSAS